MSEINNCNLFFYINLYHSLKGNNVKLCLNGQKMNISRSFTEVKYGQKHSTISGLYYILSIQPLAAQVVIHILSLRNILVFSKINI